MAENSGRNPTPQVTHKVPRPVDLAVTTVHGQHPIKAGGPIAYVKGYFSPPGSLDSMSLATVPWDYTVGSLLPGNNSVFDIAYNYNFVKILAALVQILYSCYQLYETGQPQIVKFGYAAYQLTIIPYAIMSLINILAAFCQPEFPTMFLVLTGTVDSEIIGAVGRATPPTGNNGGGRTVCIHHHPICLPTQLTASESSR